MLSGMCEFNNSSAGKVLDVKSESFVPIWAWYLSVFYICNTYLRNEKDDLMILLVRLGAVLFYLIGNFTLWEPFNTTFWPFQFSFYRESKMQARINNIY